MTSSDLLSENWHSLKIGEKVYLLKCLFNESDYELLFFHLNDCHLYYEKKDHDDIEKHFQKYNPSLNAPVNKINIHLKNCFVFEANKCEFTEKKNGSDLVISMVSSLAAGIEFKWKFQLEFMGLDAVKEYLVLPLIFNFAESQARESELCRIIQNKDKEIEDYKSQGVKLNRKYLETEVFNKDGFNAMVNKRKAEYDECPEDTLVSKQAHIIQNSCAIKYYNKSVKRDHSNVAGTINDGDIKLKSTSPSKIQKLDSSSSSDAIKEDKEKSRLEALKQEIKEKEEEANKKTPKKKKLFK